MNLREVRAAFYQTEQWLKAPNGKPTNLKEDQWLEVRTTAFKQWFGDWENSPQTSSQVVDENGEPMIVYHGTPSNHCEFAIFTIYNQGIFFTANPDIAERYATRKLGFGCVKPIYLNIRKYKKIKSVKYTFEGLRGADANLCKMSEKFEAKYPELKNRSYKYKELVRTTAEAKGFDGFHLENHSWEDQIEDDPQFVAFRPNQIKSAKSNVGTFLTSNDDIYL